MRVLGIDPGYAIVGWGVVDYEVPKFTAVDYGAVTTPAGMEFGQRLKGVHGGVSKVLELYKPDALAMAITHAQCSGSRQFDVSSLLQRAQGPVSDGMTRLQQIEKTLTAKKKK